MKIVILFFALFGIAFSNPSIQYENLLQGFPNHYKKAFHHYDKKTKVRTIEFIPTSESLEDWSEMITTTIFHNNLNIAPMDFFSILKKRGKKTVQTVL